MNTHHVSNAMTAGTVPHLSQSASTITVTSMNTVRVHAKPQFTKTFSAAANIPSPNVNIASKRARVTSRDSRDPRKLSITTEIVPTTSGSSNLQTSKKDISLDSDLRNMMHAFGDTCSPLEESIRLVESVLRYELQGFVYLCDSISALTGSKSLGLFESIFTIRNERSRLLRLIKYFVMKDQQQKLMRMNQISQGVVSPSKSYIEELRTTLDLLDESGEFSGLLESDYIVEPSKTEKALRADKTNQKLNYPRYANYSKARSVSFARKLGNLQDWIIANTRSETKMSPNYMEVLSFLAYEIVSQMIDLAFIVRRERIPSTNPISRLSDLRATNPETCMSSPAFQKRKGEMICNSVSEILVQASELEAKRLKKVTTNTKEVLMTKSMLALTPGEIGEAYSRFQRCVPPAISYKVRAEKLRTLNHQY